jgi:hypothetical protein
LAPASANYCDIAKDLLASLPGERSGAVAVVVCSREEESLDMRMKGLFVAVLLVAVPTLASAQHDDRRHMHPPADAAVDFGVLPVGPIGPPPCLQEGAIGGPADPCSYKLHVLTPEEVTIGKGGQVTFQVHGGGHAFAIYQVSKNTTRQQLGQYLCAGPDPAEIADPALHPCNLLAANANAKHIVEDGRRNVVLVAEVNLNNLHPENRVWSGPASNGQLLTYRFLETGRYLVLCMNRVHFLNDWMFGFVNVTGDGGTDD